MFSILHKQNHQKIIKRLIIIAAFLIIVICFFVYYLNSQSNKNPELKAQKEVSDLVFKVGKLIELPGDEVPTLATVIDENKVTSELFFKNAKTGDKLLAYVKNKKAILYRPSINKIVEVAPIIFDQTSK